jgi:hypothetical protein
MLTTLIAPMDAAPIIAAPPFILTAREIVVQALRELKVLAGNEAPDAADLADGLVRLNAMLKSWAAKGVSPWNEEEGTISVLAGTDRVVLQPRPTDVSGVRCIAQQGYERPMQRWEWSDYADLPNKAVTGTPSVYALRFSTSAVTLFLWPVTKVATVLNYSYGRVLDTVTQPSDPIDVPDVWLEAMYLGLAARMSSLYGSDEADPGTVGDVKQRAAVLERQLLDYDRPASYYMQSDRY